MKSAAVFLDRDGTIIEDRGYIGDPEQVRLIPGAGEAIRRFADAGYRVVVVSNQSGVARGRFDERALSAVHARVEALLEADGARLDGAYYCPYLDGAEATVEAYRRDSELRKPKPGMLLQAAREMDLDLSRSWMIGDSPRDIRAGRSAGCRTILVAPEGNVAEPEGRAPDHTVRSLLEAADLTNKNGRGKNRERSQPPPGSRQDEVVTMLGRIHNQLERSQRSQRQQDFSLLRLFGALLQMFAVVAGLWGLAALLGDESGAATARLTFACFLQLAAISAFAIERFR